MLSVNFWTCPILKCLLWLLFYLHLKYKSKTNGLSNAIHFCISSIHVVCCVCLQIILFWYLSFLLSIQITKQEITLKKLLESYNDHFKVISMSQKWLFIGACVKNYHRSKREQPLSTLALFYQIILGMKLSYHYSVHCTVHPSYTQALVLNKPNDRILSQPNECRQIWSNLKSTCFWHVKSTLSRW